MRILYIHPASIDYPGGGERFVVEISKRLANRGHNVSVLYADWIPHRLGQTQNTRELLSYGVKLYKCNFVKFPRGFPILNPHCIAKLSRECDILYISAYPPNELIIYILKKLRKISKPVVAVFHTMLQPHKDPLHKLYVVPFILAYRKFERLHVLNSYTYNLFVKHYGIDKEKVVLIPNGVDTRFFNLNLKVVERNNNRFIVLFVSRFVFEKGIDILHKVITQLNKYHNNISKRIMFRIAGSGPLRHYVEDLADKYDNVIYLGYLSRDKLVNEYNRSHVLLMPSRFENMPLTLLEASACGLPTVASIIPGIVDVIKNLGYGFLVKPEDTEGYINGILYFYNLWSNCPQKYNNIRKSIRKHTVNNYDWDVIISKIENMITKLRTE